MNKKIIFDIINVCPSVELKRALTFENYENAIDILETIYITFDPYDSEFSFFNAFHEGVEREDKEKLKNVISYSERLFFLTCAIDILKYELEENKEIFQKRYPSLYNKVILSKILIKRSNYLTDDVLEDSTHQIISRKNHQYPLTTSLKQILNLNINKEYKSIKANYLEALIHSNPFSLDQLLIAILYDDYDSLMSSYELMKYLRINYALAKEEDIKTLESNLKLIRTIGLENK